MDVAQLISAADSLASSPQGPPVGPPAVAMRSADDAEVGVSWSTKLRDLKTRFVVEQHELLALATAYEDATEQLQFETECQQCVVSKLRDV